ncbi:SRPBCC family protein [Bacillus anthracis]|uniref:SRPBCC family protein n=1 Tax=Bacillus cereus group TaxID=86661 RepID=UPI002DBCA604|nr:SRPBCC family protein [Bacillus anthracis]MEC0017834.1 SRPBCC family protein [Bacillus anthracis]
MGEILLTGYVSKSRAIDVYDKISDFKNYSGYVDIVREVTVEEITSKHSISTWKVDFENGILCWKENDYFKHEELRIDFEKCEGDIEELTGFWSVSQEDEGVIVTFKAKYNLGISMLEDILDPIAGEILAHTISEILKGILEEIELSPPKIQTIALEEETI